MAPRGPEVRLGKRGADLPEGRAPRGPEVRLGKRGADLPEGRAASEEYERRPGTSTIRQMMRPDRVTTMRRAVANWTNQTRQLVKAIRPWAAAVRALSIAGRCRSFNTAEDRFGLVQQLLAVLTQRAILPGQLVGRILHQFPAALAKILALLYQFLTLVDQVTRDFFPLAD